MRPPARLPQPTKADVAAWKRLAREARTAAGRPEASAGDLSAAERTAKRAVVLGAVIRESACVQLVRTARQFCDETARGRRELAGRMLELVAGVEALIAAATAPPPAMRHRADLDG